MINLVSTFLNSEGNYHNLTVKEPDTTKSADEIKESLELFASLNLFEKDGVNLFQKVVKAKYVEKIETPIFEGAKLFGEPTPAQPETAAIELPEPASMFFRSHAQTALNQQLQAEQAKPEIQAEPHLAVTTEAKQEPIVPAANFYTRIKEKFSWRMRRKNKAQSREAPT